VAGTDKVVDDVGRRGVSASAAKPLVASKAFDHTLFIVYTAVAISEGFR
jgi:hypothetical protein